MSDKTKAQILGERCHFGAPDTSAPVRSPMGRNKPIDRSLLENHSARKSPERIAQQKADAEAAEVLRIKNIEAFKKAQLKATVVAAKAASAKYDKPKPAAKKETTAAAKKRASRTASKAKETKKAAVKRGRKKK